MATIRKHGKKWQGIIRRKGCRPLTKSFEHKSDVTKWVLKEEAKIDTLQQGEDLSVLNTLTLGEILIRYRDTITPHKKSAKQETLRISMLLNHPIAKMKLSELNAGYFSRYRDERLRTTGPQNVRHELNTLSVIIRTAKLDWGLPIEKVWLDDIRKPKIPPARDRRLMSDEYERLKEAAQHSQTPHIWNVIDFAIETGMRIGEITSLQWCHISLSNRIAHLPDTKNGSSRNVPLSPRAAQILAEQHIQDEERPFPLTRFAASLAFRKICCTAGIKNLRFHDLRHEGISRLFELGLAIPEVALISGHKDFRMLARYTHLKAQNIVHKLV